MPLILRLALPSPLRRLFDYLPPRGVVEEQLRPGVRLRLPFGRREVVGVLIEVARETEVPPDKLRAALQLLDERPPLPSALFELCQWSAQYYQHSLGDTLSWALPALLRQGEPAERRLQRFWIAQPEARPEDPRLARAPRQRQALRTLRQHPHGVLHELLGQLGLVKDSLDLLQAKGLVTVETRYHQPTRHQGSWLAQAELPLNNEQRLAYEAVRAGSGFHCHLLEGVTGSGKTEVYLQLIRATLEAGRQALLLIPEINLGPQTLGRFEQRFNARIALLHSALTDRERMDIWLAARDGELDIVVGTRSALFTPLKHPGLIIVDEEHDASYKQQEGLRYHARDLAVVRARFDNLPVVLGSATPSLESLHNAEQGRYAHLRLSLRAGGAQPPRFERLDVRSRPLDSGLSQPLLKAMGATLERGQQVLVFLNRRGFAPTLLCHDCGWLAQCPRCDARMTYHRGSGELRCHHCDQRQTPPRHCPSCGKLDLRPVGAGTERAEERLQLLFPDVPVLRIDRDTTARKDALAKLLKIIHSGTPCILVGTQMLAKGHHFPKVTLVAVLDADSGLFSADFRASERMAQQIVQVAGRAGRAEEPGLVLIQTHLADHPLMVQLAEEGYPAFARQALQERRAAGLPPFAYLALLRADAHRQDQVENFLEAAYHVAEGLAVNLALPQVELLGPVPAPMERRAGRHRAQLLLQSSSRAPLHRLLGIWVVQLESLPEARQVRWSLDVDPIDLF
ncbi:primosomal protein N' [Pseudomonas oryzihabitans]|uniref:Replication restart protein PriA n=1 Tax=Pseudomonas oryzihabitans TaxID=47885 RepID=A0A2Z5A7E6_9PSED|nr:primosomal protein N' [Pseudomonas oryzihabitans]AXA65241.1 primosomal protein N' [Pseudomonas oryzihabitans]